MIFFVHLLYDLFLLEKKNFWNFYFYSKVYFFLLLCHESFEIYDCKCSFKRFVKSFTEAIRENFKKKRPKHLLQPSQSGPLNHTLSNILKFKMKKQSKRFNKPPTQDTTYINNRKTVSTADFHHTTSNWMYNLWIY